MFVLFELPFLDHFYLLYKNTYIQDFVRKLVLQAWPGTALYATTFLRDERQAEVSLFLFLYALTLPNLYCLLFLLLKTHCVQKFVQNHGSRVLTSPLPVDVCRSKMSLHIRTKCSVQRAECQVGNSLKGVGLSFCYYTLVAMMNTMRRLLECS